MSNDKKVICPDCGAKVNPGDIKKVAGRMMCISCAAERERNMSQISTAMQKNGR